MATRRGFLATLFSQPERLFEQRPRDENGTVATSKQPERAGQFTLRSVLVLITVLCIWLGLLRTHAELAVLVGFLAIVALGELYRRRIRQSLGEANYGRLFTVLRSIAGALAGAVLGFVGGVVVALLVPWNPLDFWATVRVSVAIGILLGVIYPRWALELLVLLPVG